MGGYRHWACRNHHANSGGNLSGNPWGAILILIGSLAGRLARFMARALPYL